MGGHVFVVHGDLRKLACDAWLVPCDASARPEPHWTAWPPDLPPIELGAASDAWRSETTRTMRVAGWPASLPSAWLANVGAYDDRAIGWYVAGAAEFLDRAAAELDGRAPQHRRAKHLLALPIVGTGLGGAKQVAGDVVRELLPILDRAARDHDVDVALVTNERPAFAAAQAERSRNGEAWRALDGRLRASGDAIATIASHGDLVLFVGAGTSAGAGLPLWGELLEALAREDAAMSPHEIDALGRLDPLDRARILERRLGGATQLTEAIARRFRADHFSLSHALLAALPVREVVTTNYDRLFELASEAIGLTVAVLPEAPAADADRWLLKMHGSVSHPSDIVATREDFLRYGERRAALAGIVQALLITRHLLFVGFSLTDDNFHRIADAVRRALQSASMRSAKFGTALVLDHDPLLEELWAGDLDWIAVGEPGSRASEAARRLDVLLDYILARTMTLASSHLLDGRYEGVLSRDERAFRDALESFVATASPEAKRAPAWTHVASLLRRLGRPPTD